jgi:hypothetical protein
VQANIQDTGRNLLLVVLLMLTGSSFVSCHTRITEADCFATPLTPGPSNAIVSWGNVCVPLGRFLLIRNGRSIAALRFLTARRVSAEGYGCAEYELYERSDGNATFRDHGYQQSRGRLSALESHGIHPFVVEDGHWRIRVAGTNLDYNSPACFSFPNANVEMAPTAWSDITAIDGAEPSLKWFRADPTGTRETYTIPNQ